MKKMKHIKTNKKKYKKNQKQQKTLSINGNKKNIKKLFKKIVYVH